MDELLILAYDLKHQLDCYEYKADTYVDGVETHLSAYERIQKIIHLLEKNNKEMCEYIKANSLECLSLDGLYNALIKEKRNPSYPQFSDHYFTGDYPIKPYDNLNSVKVKQLSLLSAKSNS